MTAVALVCGVSPFDRNHGGHKAYVRAHALAARRAGFDAHVFCVDAGPGVSESALGTVYRVPPLPVEPRVLWAPIYAPRLRAALRDFACPRREPVLLHGFGLYALPAVQAAADARAAGRPVRSLASFYTAIAQESAAKLRSAVRHYGWREWPNQLWQHAWVRGVCDPSERAILRRADRVWVNYASVERELRRRHGFDGPVHRLAYASESAFDAAAPEPATPVPAAIERLEPRDAPLVVAVSRHDPRKGLDRLLLALARLRDAGVRFRACLVGSSVLLPAHRRLCRALALEGRVAIPGWVPAPRAFLRRADVYALPSLQEGSGALSLLEALQEGVAVVASDVDGVPEDVEHGAQALLVEPGSVAALADALARLLADPALRRRLGARARRRFEERFSAAAMVDAVRKGYADLGLHPEPGAGAGSAE